MPEKIKEIEPNEQQKECIEKIDGKFLVLAGPGTGKTFTVTRRIKSMLNRGIDPNRILCLTFSEVAANEMKNKLISAMNGIDTNINIYTYHGFCNEIIGEYSELFELPDNYRVITEPVSRQFLKETVEEYPTEAYKNTKGDPYVYLKTITQKISEIKKYRYTKEQYENNLKENPDWLPKLEELNLKLEELKQNPSSKAKDKDKILSQIETLEENIKKAREVWGFYELYKSKMEKENYIDFDDMIGFVLDKFEQSEDFLDKIASKYDYIMVDEYQDTNESQNKIVFNLAKKCKNVFVVGDDDQIIFSFQGANLDTIQGFLEHFEDTKVICLKENMRSTQSILDVARNISKQDNRRLEINPKFEKFHICKDLIAKNEDITKLDKKVRCTIYQDEEQEFNEIAEEIENIVNSDKCPKDKNNNKKLSEIAVIMTGHDQLGILADKLKDRNIPIELKDGKSIYNIKSSIVLFYWLQILVNQELYSDKILKLLTLEPFNINPLDYSKIYEKLNMDETIIETMEKIDNPVDKEKIDSFLNCYKYLKNYSQSESLRNIVMEVGSKTGIFNYYTEEEINKNENISGLKKIVSEAIEFSKSHNETTLEDFVEYLLVIQNDNDLDIKTDKPPIQMNAIQLTTYHSSKGKEYEIVYMPALLKNKWESSSKSFKPTIPTSKDKYKTDDEWREYKISDRVKTMYVGMTRAKHTLNLSYYVNTGKRTTGASKWIIDSQNIMDVVTYKERDLESIQLNEKKSLTKRTYDYKRDFSNLIKCRMENRQFSPSLYNEYKACPRKFLYGDILKLNARLSIQDAANYGLCIHSACEYLVNFAIANKNYPEKEQFLEKFKEEFKKYPFSDIQKKKIYKKRGEKELDNFYHYLTNTPIKNLDSTEYDIKIELDGMKFYGRVDKLERNDDGTYNIIDYKTSELKTKNCISKDGSHRDYYSQMCLYKYYFEKATGKKVKETTFAFPIDCSTVTLNLVDKECEEVVEDLKITKEKINNCEFEPSYDKKACEYCAYKDYCHLDII